MPTFIKQAFVVPISGAVGSTVSLTTLLTAALGSNAAAVTHGWFAYYGAAAQAAWNFSYWNPAAPLVSSWTSNGVAIPESTTTQFNQSYFDVSQFSGVSAKVGNAIHPSVYLTTRIDNNAADPVYIEYHFSTVSMGLTPPPLPGTAPTAAQVVNAALTLANQYGGLINPNDCGWFCTVIPAAVGAPLPPQAHSLIPSENEEGGFWRIVHRGSDNPVSNWQTLTKPGDVVRFDWANPNAAQHSILITGTVQPDGKVEVVDNGTGVFARRTVQYDAISVASSVTIYRLTTDNLNLMNYTNTAEIILGTLLNDKIVANGGADIVKAGDGADVVLGGLGNDTLEGQEGSDQLTGGLGADVMTGGAAGDSFRFATADLQAAIVDRITDYTPGADTIRILSTVAGNSVTQASGHAIVTFGNGAQIELTGKAGQVVRLDFDNRLEYWDTGANASWAHYTDYINGLGQITDQEIINDNGTLTQRHINQAGALEYTDFFNTALPRQLTDQQVIRLDGVIEQRHYDVPGDSTNPEWTQYTDYIVRGSLRDQEIRFDNGSIGQRHFLQAGTLEYTDYVTPGGVLLDQEVINLNGTREQRHFDPAGTRSSQWSSYTDFFNASSQITARSMIYDGTNFQDQWQYSTPGSTAHGTLNHYNNLGVLIGTELF